MQSKVKLYATLLTEVLDKATEKQAAEKIARFKVLLKKAGDMQLASKIGKEFEKTWEARRGQKGEIISAAPLSKSVGDAFSRALRKKGYVPEERIQEDVLGGVAVFLGTEELVDNTFAARLQRIQKELV